MDWVIWIGTGMALAGVGMLAFCVLRVLRARSAGLTDEAMKAVLQSAVTLNLAALGISALGLMLVVVGIVLR